jgi:hypothetical protein
MSHSQPARRLVVLLAPIIGALAAQAPAEAAAPPLKRSASAFVPGSGTCVDYVSDDFEDANWKFVHNHPKSSREQDERTRGPMGKSANNRWHEGPERGQPDQIEVIPTPPGGLPGSTQALLLRTLRSGIPGYNSRDVQQDDLIANSLERLRGGIPVSERPSVTVRVYLPPVQQWERRSGPQFGFRASCSTMTVTKTAGIFSFTRENEVEPYWPGMWIHFRAAGQRGAKADSAYIAVRGDRMGRDFHAREIEQFGWWTFGMSFSPDGMVHYYASPGVDELTAADHITSQFPYSYTARQFRTYFFDVCNRNDGHTWSTPFVIDDPKLYVVDGRRIASIVERKLAQQRAQATRLAARQEARQKAQQQREERMAARREAQQQAQAERMAAEETEPSNTAMRQPASQRPSRRR